MILTLAILLTWADASNPADRTGYHFHALQHSRKRDPG
jgi:hypothetical protein